MQVISRRSCWFTVRSRGNVTRRMPSSNDFGNVSVWLISIETHGSLSPNTYLYGQPVGVLSIYHPTKTSHRFKYRTSELMRASSVKYWNTFRGKWRWNRLPPFRGGHGQMARFIGEGRRSERQFRCLEAIYGYIYLTILNLPPFADFQF